MAEEIKIDYADAIVSCEGTSNTLEISLKREKEVLLMDVDGNLVDIGSSIPPPFPIPHVLLNNITSFDPHKIYPILYSTLQDPILCDRLSTKIGSLAEGHQGPLYISLHVTITPQRVVIVYEEDQDKETCCICLEDISETGKLSHFGTLPNCLHMFHNDCIMQWLSEHHTCPICRTPIEDEEEDNDYY